jgi:hypothetical protein
MGHDEQAIRETMAQAEKDSQDHAVVGPVVMPVTDDRPRLVPGEPGRTWS